MSLQFRQKYRYRHGQPPSGGGSTSSVLQASDLTFLGQVDTTNGNLYTAQNVTLRRVAGEQRFLVYEYDANHLADFTASIAGTTMTVTSVASGSLAVGQYVRFGITSSNDGTYITALGTGAGSTGTYIVNKSQTFGSAAINTFRDAATAEAIGDLVEYHLTQPLKNGSIHWVSSNVPQWVETRRWKTWTTIGRMKASSSKYSNQWASQGQNGAVPAGFYWDEGHGVMWYSFIPVYSGGSIIWPSWNCVKLLDAEAGSTVSDTNIYGPYYFRNSTVVDDWKDGSHGLFPIDPSRTAAMGGKYITVGHHQANIDPAGAHSIGMWVVDDLPSPPARDTTLWPGAIHIYDTTVNSGHTYNPVHKPNFALNSCRTASNSDEDYQSIGGTGSNLNDGDVLGTSSGDIIYVHSSFDYIDCVTVFMNSTASGGTYVPEIRSTGGSWVQPSSWVCTAGTAGMGGLENVFSWPKTAYDDTYIPPELAAIGVWFGGFVRLRRTSSGSNGGHAKGVIASISMVGLTSGNQSGMPEPVGGYVRPGSTGTVQYDTSHYSFQQVDFGYGGAWVKTPAVEGLAYFGQIGCGGYAYATNPNYSVPSSGGTPIKYESANISSATYLGIDWSNGPRYEGPYQPYFMPFKTDDMLSAAATSSNRYSDFLNPNAYSQMYDTWPGLITVSNVDNPRMVGDYFYGLPRIFLYYNGHSVMYDTTAQQLIVLLAAKGDMNHIMAFFSVRSS